MLACTCKAAITPNDKWKIYHVECATGFFVWLTWNHAMMRRDRTVLRTQINRASLGKSLSLTHTPCALGGKTPRETSYLIGLKYWLKHSIFCWNVECFKIRVCFQCLRLTTCGHNWQLQLYVNCGLQKKEKKLKNFRVSDRPAGKLMARCVGDGRSCSAGPLTEHTLVRPAAKLLFLWVVSHCIWCDCSCQLTLKALILTSCAIYLL